jgi:hypothetical protein
VGSAKRERDVRRRGAAPGQHRCEQQSGRKEHSPDHVTTMAPAAEWRQGRWSLLAHDNPIQDRFIA